VLRNRQGALRPAFEPRLTKTNLLALGRKPAARPSSCHPVFGASVKANLTIPIRRLIFSGVDNLEEIVDAQAGGHPYGDDCNLGGRLACLTCPNHARGSWPPGGNPKLHADREGCLWPVCGALVWSISPQGLRSVPLLVRPLLTRSHETDTLRPPQLAASFFQTPGVGAPARLGRSLHLSKDRYCRQRKNLNAGAALRDGIDLHSVATRACDK
jgi:hypothetical protein